MQTQLIMKSKKRIVILTGAGISAESGIQTFRDSDGLWENYNVKEIATPEGWKQNKEKVLDFYNQRRKQLSEVKPNKGHKWLVKLEKYYDVQIITQNVDDLHERAGSTKVLHLHGELKKVRSTADPSLIHILDGWELKLGDKCKKGSQLRPHIVWFGEPVPLLQEAVDMVADAEILIIIGTSLQVYPAANLVYCPIHRIPKYFIDPKRPTVYIEDLEVFEEKASTGVPKLVKKLISKA